MHYRIIENPTYTNTSKVGIVFEPDNRPLRLFFAALKLHTFPNALAAMIDSTGYGEEMAQIRYFREMDWEDIAELEGIGGIKEGDVNVSVNIGEMLDAVLPEHKFDALLRDFALKLIEMHADDDSLPAQWNDQMRAGIKRLEGKLKRLN
jgi:hypothetical protein